jgi:RNA methyltransferase, TrmH family
MHFSFQKLIGIFESVNNNITKAQITHIKQLQDNNYRKEFGIYFAEGEKIYSEFKKFPSQIQQVLSTKPLLEPHTLITVDQMHKISALQIPTNVLVVLKIPTRSMAIDQTFFTLVLDGIQDPGNLGTIIRIADWFGIKNVICSVDCADAYSPKVVQASMGSIARVNVHKTDLLEIIQANLNLPTYVATLNGFNLYEMPKPKNGFIIIGSEGKGVSKEILDICENKITIPGNGACESLNASVACGIICSHLI